MGKIYKIVPLVRTAVSDVRKRMLEIFTFKIKQSDMRLLRKIFSFTHILVNTAKFTL